MPSTQKVNNVMVNFLSDEEVDPGAIARLSELEQSRKEIESQDEFPVNRELHRVEREIGNILRSISKAAGMVIKNCEEIHGITRARIAAVVGQLDQEVPLEEAELTVEPSIYGEICDYLERQGITDRLSFEKVLFGYRGRNTANWYRNCGIRGLFPTNLVEIVLGRRLGKALTEADLIAAGDKLFGELDKDPLVTEVREMLISRGVNSRTTALELSNKVIGEIARESSAGSSTILFRILAGSRPQLLGKPMNKVLADCLFSGN